MNKKQKDLLSKLNDITSELLSLRDEFEDDDFTWSYLDDARTSLDETIETLEMHFDD